jgi:hypothetical protein
MLASASKDMSIFLATLVSRQRWLVLAPHLAVEEMASPVVRECWN